MARAGLTCGPAWPWGRDAAPAESAGAEPDAERCGHLGRRGGADTASSRRRATATAALQSRRRCATPATSFPGCARWTGCPARRPTRRLAGRPSRTGRGWWSSVSVQP